MSAEQIPPAILDLFAGLEASPSEAVQRFAGLSRWARGKRSRSTPEKLREELGRAHREEVARVLGGYAALSLYEDPSVKNLLHRCVRVRERLELPTSTSLGDAAHGLQGSPNSAREGTREELAVLQALASGEVVDRLQVVLLSWRLCAVDRTALQAGIEYKLLGEWKSSERFIETVRASPTSSLNLSYAWEFVGSLRLAQGRCAEASLAFRKASECGEDRPTALFSWLVLSLCSSEASAAEVAAKRIEDLAPDDFEIDTTIRCYLELRKRGIFDARIDGVLGRRIASLGDHVERTIHALS